MSVVRLLVLGVIRMRGQVHGYGVHQELLSWHVQTWTSVRPGSIYHALKQLTKEGKLRAVGLEGSGAGPDRTLYELTGEGQAELVERLEAALSSFSLEQIGAGVAFMQTLPRQRVIELVRAQLERARANRDYLDGLVPSFPERDEPPHMQDLLTLWSGALGATAGWTERLLERLEAGEYVMAGETKPDPAAPQA